MLRNEAIEFHKKEKSYKKRIEELELELALSKERMSIGSQILREIVLDTRDSLKYFLQSFDLITESSSKEFSRRIARKATSKQTQLVHEGVTQNVPTKKPKLITKQRQKLKDVNARAGKDSRLIATNGIVE